MLAEGNTFAKKGSPPRVEGGVVGVVGCIRLEAKGREDMMGVRVT